MRALLAVALTLAVLAGCSEGDPGADGDVESLGDLVPGPVAGELTEFGTCPDGLRWAVDDTGWIAVTLEGGRAGDEADLPSDEVVVTLLHGEDLAAAVCDPSSEAVAARSPAAQGRIELCPAGFRIDGLVAEDGTTFGPIDVRC